jgi:hypothetical protein
LFFVGITGAEGLAAGVAESVMTVSNVAVTAGELIKIDYALQLNATISVGDVNLTVNFALLRNSTTIQTFQFQRTGLALGDVVAEPINYTFVDTAPSTSTFSYSLQLTYTATGLGTAAVSVEERYMNVIRFI